MATNQISNVPISADASPNFWTKFIRNIASDKSIKRFEVSSLLLFVIFAWATIYIFYSQDENSHPLSPPIAAAILVFNLLPASILIALLGRRIALKRAGSKILDSQSKLHVRLVGIFSLITTIPVLLLVIFASLLFQNGVQFWFSDPARDMLQNAESLANGYYQEKLTDVRDETEAMAGDIRYFLSQSRADNPQFLDAYFSQVLTRKLSESAIVSIDNENVQKTTAVVASDNEKREEWITSTMLGKLNDGEGLVVEAQADKIEAVTILYDNPRLYLYTARLDSVPSFIFGDRAERILSDYDNLIIQSRNLQIQFNIALYIVSLLIIGVAIWIALIVADRLVRPVNQLVLAAQKVADGDLSARVSVAAQDSPDEVGILSNSFNVMTERLEAQNRNLLLANNQLDSRRAFIETVLESVSAGIISLDDNNNIILANSNAAKQLAATGKNLIGVTLEKLSPDLAQVVDSKNSEAVIQIGDGPEPQTLAVKIRREKTGSVLTFEDISEQLADQKRAAWSDVARRIAHEIKNPLTPIQLAAERLKRRFSEQVGDGNAVFDQLTDTIVRQVGDLRKIADEFSSFARMPKPTFREEDIADIVRHSVFLHEVSKTEIDFNVTTNADNLSLLCDRRQIGQAITNVVKNATEAVEERISEGGSQKGWVNVSIIENQNDMTISISDNGIGLPPEKGRIVEPYVTTRSSGSGLGLAIVKKIVEEHYGKMAFDDLPDGGARVTMIFDTAKLKKREPNNLPPEESSENI